MLGCGAAGRSAPRRRPLLESLHGHDQDRRSLRKHYGGVVALDDMDLEVAAGTHPRGRRRERRRQVDADEGARGSGPTRQRARSRSTVEPVEFASPQGAGRARHRHRLPGAQPPPRAPGARQPLRRPPADPLRPRRSRAAMEQRAQPVLERLGLDVDTDLPVGRADDRRAPARRAGRVLARAVPAC